MSTKRPATTDEISLIINALELLYGSVKRALNGTKNPKLIAVYDEELTKINSLQRDISILELPL